MKIGGVQTYGLWNTFPHALMEPFAATGRVGAILNTFLDKGRAVEIANEVARDGKYTIIVTGESYMGHREGIQKARLQDRCVWVGSIPSSIEDRSIFLPLWAHRIPELCASREAPGPAFHDRPYDIGALIDNSYNFNRVGTPNLNQRLQLLRGLEARGFKVKFQGLASPSKAQVPREDAVEWLKDCKFHLAAENAISPYYLTEKLVLGYDAGCVPVYMGGSEHHWILSSSSMAVLGTASHDEVASGIMAERKVPDLIRSMPLLSQSARTIPVIALNLFNHLTSQSTER